MHYTATMEFCLWDCTTNTLYSLYCMTTHTHTIMITHTHTHAHSMQCNYVIDVDVHVPWAPDIEVRQPLLIKAPANVVVSSTGRNTEGGA